MNTLIERLKQAKGADRDPPFLVADQTPLSHSLPANTPAKTRRMKEDQGEHGR